MLQKMIIHLPRKHRGHNIGLGALGLWLKIKRLVSEKLTAIPGVSSCAQVLFSDYQNAPVIYASRFLATILSQYFIFFFFAIRGFELIQPSPKPGELLSGIVFCIYFVQDLIIYEIYFEYYFVYSILFVAYVIFSTTIQEEHAYFYSVNHPQVFSSVGRTCNKSKLNIQLVSHLWSQLQIAKV